MLIDLQLHSIYSDGYLRPAELVDFISKHNIKVASLTDHNTLHGLLEFKKVCKAKKIKAINGLELYCKYKNKKINILWYNFDENNQELLSLLEESRKRRLILVKKSLLRLKRRGFVIKADQLLEEFKNYIPVNRLSEKIISNKFNFNKIKKEFKSVNKLDRDLREEDIMGILFFNKKENYLNESYINIERVIKIREKAGGHLVFCHPGKHNKYANNMAQKLKQIGIDGIEVLSPHHPIGAVMYAQFLSESLDMISTGGSDFHRFEENSENIKSSMDWFCIDSKNLRRIKEIIG